VHLLLVVGLAICTGPRSGGASRAELATDLTAPSEWVLEWMEEDGRKLRPGGRLKLDRRGHGEHLFKGLHYQIVDYRLDPTTQPASIDLRLRNVKAKRADATGFRVLGIYRVDGDRLFLCLAQADERPTEFATKPLDGRFLFVLRRKK
jgi:uncharacterized protein (TIGR03067 family)